MKKLSFKETRMIIAGDRKARLLKQAVKCENGSARACRRAERMLNRM